jgi:hypothetical protein
VVSDGFWRDRFGGDPRALGASLQVAGTPVTIVGVTPPSFHGVWPGVEPKLYLPMQFLTVLQGRDDLNSPSPKSAVWCAAIGRLRPGVATLGASRGDILRMVLADALGPVAIGVGLGTVALFLAAGPIRHLLYGVSAFDLTTVAVTAALLTLVVLAASFWPARRAASVDPIQAMRAD